MKTIIKLMVVLFMTALCAPAFAASTAGIGDSPFTEAFATFASLVAAIPVAVELTKRLFGVRKITPRWVVVGISWFTGLVVTACGWLLGAGILLGLTWWQALIIGFGATLSANGVFSTKIIQTIIGIVNKKV